jgi:uncharacterized Zn finger protein
MKCPYCKREQKKEVIPNPDSTEAAMTSCEHCGKVWGVVSTQHIVEKREMIKDLLGIDISNIPPWQKFFQD